MSAGPEWGPLARWPASGRGRRERTSPTPTRRATSASPPTASTPSSSRSARWKTASNASTGWTTAWRPGEGTEENPFHTEVGYWLWDATDGQVMRCFLIPRGSALIAGGAVEADATTFTLTSEVGSETYGILSNRFLAAQARTVRYEVTIDLSEDGVFSYEETSVIEHGKLPDTWPTPTATPCAGSPTPERTR